MPGYCENRYTIVIDKSIHLPYLPNVMPIIPFIQTAERPYVLNEDDIREVRRRFSVALPMFPKHKSCLAWAMLCKGVHRERYPHAPPLRIVAGSAYYPLSKTPREVPPPKDTHVSFEFDSLSVGLAEKQGSMAEIHVWNAILEDDLMW